MRNKQQKRILVINPPKACWASGYSVSRGNNTFSLNKTSLYANQNGITADQQRLQKSFSKLKETLQKAGYDVTAIDFPPELDTRDCKYHDAVFIRDNGIMYQDYWIQANFSAENRQIEAEIYSQIIKEKFNKQVLTLPAGAYMEFGEVYYIETSQGSYYFGGLSRANQKGHDFVCHIMNPDKACFINSKGFHLDTVFTPVLNTQNQLCAVIVAENMIDPESLLQLKQLEVEIIPVNNEDSLGEDGLGNYAVNCVASEGVLISGSYFATHGVHNRLESLGIKLYVVDLKDFFYAGGSVHCLTNEIFTS